MKRAIRAVGRTLAILLPVMFGVVTAVFLLLRIVPGDPAVMILGERATDEQISALRTELGLNLPLWQQYLSFLGQIFLHGDTGESLATGLSTRELVLSRAPISLGIVGLAVLFALLISVPLALAAAKRQGKAVDHIVRVLPTITMGMPLFWIGLILILIFAVRLGWFPVGGVGSSPLDPLYSLVLPSLAVALGMAPPLIRSLRAQLLEAMSLDFVTTLRVARVPERTITWKHVLRNAAVPTLTLLSVNTAALVGGTLVVERVFGINGLGTLLFQAISTRDFPVVQGVALYCAVFVVLIGLVAGAVSALIDPRLRAEEGRRK